jgi:PIN domain nuclease of toxin-antitoxin system
MRFLLDTHAFLWFVLDDRRLSERAKALIATPENNVEISPATYWEIAIKIRLGKYSLSEPADQFFDRQVQINRFQILHIQPRHVGPLTSLPFHHRDPFDRLIISQAIVEQIPVVTEDALFDSYPIRRLW